MIVLGNYVHGNFIFYTGRYEWKNMIFFIDVYYNILIIHNVITQKKYLIDVCINDTS